MSKTLPPLEYLPETTRPPPLEKAKPTSGTYIQPTQAQLDEKIDFYAENQKKQANTEKMKRAIKSNPFIPLGMLVTIGVLGKGLFAMKNKDVAKSQAMMRYRVAAQGATVLAMIVGTFVTQLVYKPDE